jgi:hypothetical protein
MRVLPDGLPGIRFGANATREKLQHNQHMKAYSQDATTKGEESYAP